MRILFLSCMRKRLHRARTFRGRGARMRGCCPAVDDDYMRGPGCSQLPRASSFPVLRMEVPPTRGARLHTNSFRTHVAKAVLCDRRAYGGCREASCAACVIVRKFCNGLDSLVRRMDFPCARINDSQVFHFVLGVDPFRHLLLQFLALASCSSRIMVCHTWL